MSVRTLAERRSVPMAATAAFLVAVAVTGAFFGGFIPTIPKTLPTFISLVNVTGGLFVIAVVAWVVSIVLKG